MHDEILVSPAELAALRARLAAFAPKDRSRGSSYFRGGAVREIRPLDEEFHGAGSIGFEADVMGSQLYTVEWLFTPSEGWGCSCTCPVEIDCKHAYAAAEQLLIRRVGGPNKGVQGAFLASAPPPLPAPGEAARLVALLEQRHGRRLTKAEVAFVGKLERLWQRHQRDGTIYPQELADVSLADRGAGLYYDPNPAIRGWWSEPLGSPLELWQFLAYFAERANRPLPPLMKPLTDTTPVRARIEEHERKRRVEHWKQVFHQPSQSDAAGTFDTVPEVRLRLAEPKLIWEYRSAPDAPWRAAKGAVVKRWFEVASSQAAGVPAATLALLQEVQLRRLQARQGFGYYGSSTEPQTLKLDDATTTAVIHWIVSHPGLRHMFVNNDGLPYEVAPQTLTWVARPASDDAHDVEIFLAMPDGAPLPSGLVELDGQPPLGLYGNLIYTLPPRLPGIDAGAKIQIPREALEIPEAVRHLGRARVRPVGGLALPELHRVVLVPRFICSVHEQLAGRDLLRVELHARSDDGARVCVRQGDSWLMPDKALPGGSTKSDGRIVDLDLSRADPVIRLLAELGLQWTGWAHGWERPMSKNFPEEFAAWAATVQAAGAQIECDPQLAGLLRPADRARVEIDVAANEAGGAAVDWFDLRLVVRAEDTTLTDEEIALLLKARGRFVLLKDKGWRRLELALDDTQAAQLRELGLDAGALEGGAQHQRFHALQLADERIAGLLPEQHAARVRERAAGMRAIAAPPQPVALTAELRPYQQEGFHFLAHLSTNGLGGVLADDMGLGKTVQALAWLLWLSAEHPPKQSFRALVVCPKSVVTNWENETHRFAPTLAVAAWRAKSQSLPKSGLVVVNYAQLRLAADTLGAVVWDAVILDEGQNIKNPASQTAKVARELRATHRLVLTGTPIENRVLDLWSLFAFAMPGLLGGQTAFKRTFDDKSDPLARARLARRVRHFMLRRTKGQVAADLPPRIEEDLVVELETAQRKLYEAELKRARQMLLGVGNAREFDAQRFNILQSLLRLRQICCDPRLLGASTAAGDSAKIGALLEQIEPILEEGYKVLIFSQFVSMLELLAPELAAREIKYLTITGQTENRQELVDEFQNTPEIQVFLLSLKAAGSGLNLTAASYVVLFDPWWNPAVEAQAIDRTHRIGQVNQVIAYRLLAKDTVEEKIRLLQKAKAELARAVVQEESLASVMNLDDLRYVLS